MRLVFLGPPGAGKGTQAGQLARRLQVTTLSSGDLLREAGEVGDPRGVEAERFMRKGKLVPDLLVTELVLKRIAGFGKHQPFVLDGFPRTETQARDLDRRLSELKQDPVGLAVDFEMSAEKVVERLAGRRVCGACRTNYHQKTLPPRQAGVCDRCGGVLQTRDDDEPETIRKRLVVYRNEMKPLLEFYEKQGKLRTLSGALAVKEQYQALVELLKSEHLISA